MSKEPDAARWTRVGREADLAGAGPYVANADGVDLVLVRGARGLKAYEGRCPHQGALLGEGELDGGALVCRNHRWRFDVETGERRGGESSEARCIVPCPVRVDVEGGNVEVDASGLARARVARGARSIADLPGPPSLPLVGSAYLVTMSRFHLQLETWCREFGTPFTYRLGPRQTVVLGDVDSFLPALRERPDTFKRISNVPPIFRELGVDGVFSAEGQSWRVQRRLSMEALSQRHLRTFYPTLGIIAERLRKRWTNAAARGDVLDLNDELKRFTVDVTTRLVFGYDIDTLQAPPGGDVIQRKLELIITTLNRRIFAVAPWWRLLRTPTDRRVERAVREMHEWIGVRVEQARAGFLAVPGRAERPENFLEAMLVARDEQGEPFSVDTIYGNLMTMLGAGEETTAYTLAWAVHHLCDAPAAVDALRAELHAVLGEAAIPSTIEAANQLAFAGAIANESMRLRPVASLIFLEACTDTTVADVAIPRGTVVLAMTRPPAMDPQNFGDPDVFRPARWVDPAATGGAHNPGANLPFGSGPRICPGRSLALLEMKLVLATLYASFDVERVGASSDVRERLSFTMMPGGLRVRLRARTDGAASGLREPSTSASPRSTPVQA